MIDGESEENRCEGTCFTTMSGAVRAAPPWHDKKTCPFLGWRNRRCGWSYGRQRRPRTIRTFAGLRSRGVVMRQGVRHDARHQVNFRPIRGCIVRPYNHGWMFTTGACLRRDAAEGQERQQRPQSRTPVVPARTPHVLITPHSTILPTAVERLPIERIKGQVPRTSKETSVTNDRPQVFSATAIPF
jgi:hypothetical protein